MIVFNPFRVSEELIPAVIRTPKHVAWLRVLLRPLKTLTDKFLIDYCQGITASAYNGATAYVYLDRVTWTDLAVYELIVSTSTGVDPTGNALSSTNWRKIQMSAIGADDRVKVNGQLIKLTYAVNQHYGVTSNPYIYFTAITPGVYSSVLTVHVPIAVFNTMGPDIISRGNNISRYLKLYVPAEFTYNITTY